MFATHQDLQIVRYEGDFDAVKHGLAALKPFEFVDEATVICDLSRIITRVRQWQHHLPRVQLTFPVKINSDPLVLRVLERLGVKFSCNCKDEIRAMRLKGILPEDLIFANPVKIISHLRCAQKQQVGLLVVDSLDELEKVKMYHPEAKVMLKIFFQGHPPGTSGCDSKTDALKLMMEAKNLDVNLIGISFDNESGTFNSEDYKTMLITTRTLFDYGKGILGLDLDTIHIGGGVPAAIDPETFSHFSAVIAKIMTELFADPSIKVLAEPAEFLVAPSMTLFTTIQARKEFVGDEGIQRIGYYVNCSFKNCGNRRAITDMTAKWVPDEDQADTECTPSVIYGGSGEPEDQFPDTPSIPFQFVGDVIYFENAGAHLLLSQAGFKPPSVKYFLKDTCKIIL